jgi:Carboxypeptidase regulatory-like domain
MKLRSWTDPRYSIASTILARFLIGLALAVVPMAAQVGTTSVRGRVTDTSGAIVVGAKVTLTDATRALGREQTTTNTGDYEFLALPPGTYVLTVERAGFRPLERKDLQLLVGSVTAYNVMLAVGTTTESVQVSAQAEALNTTDASLGIPFDENQVKELPLEGRNVPDLLTLQPGVVYTGNRPDVIRTWWDTRSGAVNGARSDQGNVTLDGIQVNDEGGDAFTSVVPVTLDSVQEFRVSTTNYNADQGGTSGAQVALVTKSGTNTLHGSAYEYLRNTYTSANDFFVKQAELQSGQPNIAPKLIRNIFGASVGGPIRKDRLFFFLNYEGTRRAEEQGTTQTVPTASRRDGITQYVCQLNSDGSPNTALCPGGQVQGLSGQSYTVAPGNFGFTAGQLQAMDPLGLGANTVSLNYFKTMPLPNSSAVGDGLNVSGFNFRAPIHETRNVYIAKLDFNITQNGKHRMSISGSLNNDSASGVSILPGQPPFSSTVNYNKGLIANYVGLLSQNIVNNLRYGYIRESPGTIGDGNPQVFLFNVANLGPSYSNYFQRPIHSFADDLSWIRGKHTFRFGASAGFSRTSSGNNSASTSIAFSAPGWLQAGGFAGHSGSPFNPENSGYPAVDPSFAQAYDNGLGDLLGMVTYVNATYNYQRNGTATPTGGSVSRDFAINSYEFYGQDTWKVKPNLTVTYGLRWSLSSPPWEVHGLQVAPTFGLAQWFKQRAINMENMIPSSVDPPVTFDWAGRANHKPGYWNWDKKDFAPRLALAWSPKASSGWLKNLLGDGGKTAVRAGVGMAYDRFGQSIVDYFDQYGSFGLATSFTDPPGVLTETSAPRLTSISVVPTTDNNGNPLVPSPPALQYPETYPTGLFEYLWTVDNSMKTPYSYTLDFSVGRELPSGFSLEASYVGRLGRRLLNQQDLAMPLDIRDKGTGVDYFTAATALGKVYRSGVTSQNFDNSMVSGPVAKYWQDLLQPLQPGGAYTLGTTGGCGSGGPASTTNPVLAAFDLFCGAQYNETFALQILDTNGIPDASQSGQNYFTFTGKPYTFYNPQFPALYAWRTTSNSIYNALQVTLRHKLSHGVQFDLNYTFSKSIDTASSAERVGGSGGLSGIVINSFQPNALRAVSDFDVRHQLNSNWVVQLPFGKGRFIGRNDHAWTEALIGGWQLSGLFRMTSGFPLTIGNGYYWPTNWGFTGDANQTGPVKTGVYRIKNSDGTTSINIFANGSSAQSSFSHIFPGQAGGRNQIRGDGYFGIDMGLAKRWSMPWSESQSLQFRWEVFNITNSVRFDVAQTNSALGGSAQGGYGTFGNYTGVLTNPRVMQFAMRYEF